MCGICGVVSLDKKEVDEQLVGSMMDQIRHRGPDDEGKLILENVGLGFVRLSILDLTHDGHQPMKDISGRFTIIFNGEIYNYIELKGQLRSKGYQFNSRTDTEVLLKAFIEWDAECLNYLNGMFAFAIYDKKDKRTFIARDRFGIKPLYYSENNNQFIFGSEIPALLEVLPSKKIKANKETIFNYLAFNRTDQTTETFFEGIKKLQHGHYIDILDNKVKISRWYNISEKLNSPFSGFEEFREMFSSSVGLRLRSDVPVGVCLSGGLDSSSIVSTLLNDYGKNDLNTFSAVYGVGKKGDESEYIRLYEERLMNMHYICPSSHSLFEDIDVFIGAHAEPVPSTSPYAQFKVMELAKGHVKVTLDGQGADEILAGYHYFFGNYFKELLYNFQFIKLFFEGYHYLKQHQSLLGVKSFIFFLLPGMLKTTARLNEKRYIHSDFADYYKNGNIVTGKLYESIDLKKALVNHFEFKLEHLLKWADRNSMWFSIESRVPFLDYRLVERTLSLPSNQIINKGYTKFMLRNAMNGTLPEEIRMRQDKIGFSTPEDEWFRKEHFKTLTLNLIHSKSFKERDFFDSGRVINLYMQHLEGKINISKEIWKWINLELWFRKFID